MNRHAFGHFATDVLLRLGLLGTIIGFIFMLLPVADIKDFDGAVMQRLLASMSGGMAVALYTTLAGLVSSTLLRFQYHVLDSAAVDLANRVSTHVETRVGLGVDET
jgi:biopolymer transport protein ExbB/TolQ